MGSTHGTSANEACYLEKFLWLLVLSFPSLKELVLQLDDFYSYNSYNPSGSISECLSIDKYKGDIGGNRLSLPI